MKRLCTARGNFSKGIPAKANSFYLSLAIDAGVEEACRESRATHRSFI
jgi:hypothetical protein